MTRSPAALVPALVAVAVAPLAALAPQPETIAAWHRYVAGATPQLHECGTSCCHSMPVGQAIDVAGGSIHHWKGSMLVRRTTVDRVVNTLMYPGTPPPQEDVLESRVLGRHGDTIRVYLKLARSAVVTVVYDTEHTVTFRRQSPTLATSRSISTKIAEAGGGDRGFLWRLNSYWRYSRSGEDVRVDLESISLGRDVPWFVRSVAAPIINRIARESMARTLTSVRRFLQGESTTVDVGSACSTS